MTIRLSKSKLIAFRQCPKRLWLEVHCPELKITDASSEARFAVGHQVGELARLQYPDGILIAPDNDLSAALSETKLLLDAKPKKVLFEATFQAEDILVRADLLVPVKGGWHMVEVKSSTQVKDYHLEDAAIQSWVASRAGLRLSDMSLQVIDSKWTYPGSGNYSGLLQLAPIDHEIKPLQREVPKWLAAAKNVANASEPSVKMGKQCNEPFACGYQEYCASLAAPIQFPITWLPSLHHSKMTKFEAAGFVDMREVALEDLTDKQARVWNATLNDEVYFAPLSKAEASVFRGTRYYLDFETINFAVPMWAGTKPYQQIPFQWSCHIEYQTGVLSHEMFLDLSGDDPSRDFAESLVKVLGTKGPIVVYNQSFEKRIISELGERFEDLSPKLTALLARVVDLLPLTKAHFYHPSMQGSWSIKSVLPAIDASLNYGNLESVGDGMEAQSAYAEATRKETSGARRLVLQRALEKYCERDTAAMLSVLHYLHSGGVRVIEGS